MNEEMIEKVRELVRTGDPKDAQIALEMLSHRNSDVVLWELMTQRWNTGAKKVLLCEYLRYNNWKELEIVCTFVEFHANETSMFLPQNTPCWWVPEERNPKKHIDKKMILDLRKGFWVCQDATINLSLWDRIRILFGAKLEVRCEHDCDKEVMVSKGSASITVGKPKVTTSQLGGSHP